MYLPRKLGHKLWSGCGEGPEGISLGFGRIWVQEKAWIVGDHQKLGQRPGTDSPSEPLKGPVPMHTWILDLWLSEL